MAAFLIGDPPELRWRRVVRTEKYLLKQRKTTLDLVGKGEKVLDTIIGECKSDLSQPFQRKGVRTKKQFVEQESPLLWDLGGQ